MFDHFQNMFGLRKTPKNCDPEITPKNQLFGKKKFLDFPADQFFFLLKFFWKKFLVPAPPGKMSRIWKKRRFLWPQKHDCIGNNIFNGEKRINIYKKYTDTILNVQSIQPYFFYMFWCIIDYLMNQHWFQAPYRIQL